MIFTTLTLLLAQPMPLKLEDKPFAVTAQMTDEKLTVGKQYSFAVNFTLADARSASELGVPAPILQLDTPPSVKLVGKILETYEELTANEFLSAPYERLLKKNESTIEFELVAEPKQDATIGVVVLAYVTGAEGSEPIFVRRRLELPISAGSRSHAGDDRNSHWGIDDKLLQIGDTPAGFDLPRADGSRLALDDVLYEQNVLVMTYRAYW